MDGSKAKGESHAHGAGAPLVVALSRLVMAESDERSIWDIPASRARPILRGAKNRGPRPEKGEGVGMSSRAPESETLLTPAEVAAMFRVDPKTVTRWAKAGKLSSIRTLGGHRRYREAEVRAFLSGIPQQPAER